MSNTEGDTQMSPVNESSPGDGSDAMFPSANDDAPSTFHAMTSTPQTGELSPPYSQDQPDADGDEAMDLTGGESTFHTSSQTTTKTAGSDMLGKGKGTKIVDEKRRPGQSWDNPKAREEYQKQWNGLLDKKFSLKRFGDPFGDDQTQGGH